MARKLWYAEPVSTSTDRDCVQPLGIARPGAAQLAADAGRCGRRLHRQCPDRIHFCGHRPSGRDFVGGYRGRLVGGATGLLGVCGVFCQRRDHADHEPALQHSAGLWLDDPRHGSGGAGTATPELCRGDRGLLCEQCAGAGSGFERLGQTGHGRFAHAHRDGHGGRGVPALWSGHRQGAQQRRGHCTAHGGRLCAALGSARLERPHAAGHRRFAGGRGRGGSLRAPASRRPCGRQRPCSSW